MPDYSAARYNMVEGQVRPNKVTDQALVEAMSRIPRELFVPKASRGIAYVDEDIPVAKGRYLIEPMVIARLLQEARIRPTDIVLDVGACTGYGSALLSRMAATVVALEIRRRTRRARRSDAARCGRRQCRGRPGAA